MAPAERREGYYWVRVRQVPEAAPAVARWNGKRWYACAPSWSMDVDGFDEDLLEILSGPLEPPT